MVGNSLLILINKYLFFFKYLFDKEPIKSILKPKKAIYGNFLHNILSNFAFNN